MTPKQIFEEMDALPPLWRPKFIERLVGIEVDWPVTFADAWETDGKAVRVAFHFEPMSVRGIMGTVSLETYPQLERLRAGERLRVRGRIRKIDRMFLEMDISDLLFCVEAEPAVA